MHIVVSAVERDISERGQEIDWTNLLIFSPPKTFKECNLLPPTLHNSYSVMRHETPESYTDLREYTSPAKAWHSFGLTKEGIQGARQSFLDAYDRGDISTETIFGTSGFQRCRSTLIVGLQALVERWESEGRTDAIRDLPQRVIPFHAQLRDRFFGEFKTTSEARQSTNLKDRSEPLHRTQGVESPGSVTLRETLFIRQCEASYRNKRIFLVAHADGIHFLRAAWLNLEDIGDYAELYPKRGEIVKLGER